MYFPAGIITSMKPVKITFRHIALISLFFISSSLLLSLLNFIQTTYQPNLPRSGFSIFSIAIIVLFFSIFISFITLLIKSFFQKTYIDHFLVWINNSSGGLTRSFFAASIGFIFSWWLVYTPTIQWGFLAGYAQRMQPFFVWLFITVSFFSSYILVYQLTFKKEIIKTHLIKQKRHIQLFGLILFILTCWWLFTLSTGYGLVSKEPYWNQIGVPILVQQIVLALGITGLFHLIERKWLVKFNYSDTVVFILIWLIASLIWTTTPIEGSFFNPGPYPPSHEFYPLSDAARFDVASLNILVGGGFGSKSIADRPVLTSILVLFHLFFGPNYQPVMAAYAVLMALLPAVLYLIGKLIFGRGLGIFLATIITIHAQNAILLNRLVSSNNPQVPLSDYLNGLWLSVLLLFLLSWNKKQQKVEYLMLAGFALGLATLTKPNALALLPALFFGLWFLLNSNNKNFLQKSLFLMIGLALCIGPWFIRYSTQSSKPLFISRLTGILNDRVSQLDWAEDNPQQNNNPSWSTSYTNLPAYASAHWVHNLNATFLMLPTSPFMTELKSTVQAENSRWRKQWDGSFNGTEIGFIFIHLMVLTLGLITAWRKTGWAGLLPILILMFYFAGNALVRTSGGRYITPVQWVIFIYYGIGILQVFGWVLSLFNLSFKAQQPTVQTAQQSNMRVRLFSFAALCLAGFGFIFLENIFPEQRPQATQMEAIHLLSDSAIQSAGYTRLELENFILNGGQAWQGLALYPRFYAQNDDEGRFGNHQALFADYPFPRLTFFTLSQQEVREVILPGPSYKNFSHFSNLIILGCENTARSQNSGSFALMAFMPDDIVFAAQPPLPLACPLPEIICDNNKSCSAVP